MSERAGVIPASFRVLVTRRPKVACRTCAEGVAQALAPARLVEGGLPTEATVAHVFVSKDADHLPLYRQAQIFARQGLVLDRRALADRVGHAARELRPVHARLVEILKASLRLVVDETRAPVLDPGRGRTRTGWFRALARDDRPWSGPARPRSPSPIPKAGAPTTQTVTSRASEDAPGGRIRRLLNRAGFAGGSDS